MTHGYSKGYPRMVTPDWKPFNPVELAKWTERIVCRNDRRKYTNFGVVGVYRGISSAYVVGCSLRCCFCWVSPSRDWPERFGEFYSPQEVFDGLDRGARKHGVKKLRISGGEPTLGKEHLLGVLECVERAPEHYLFILETNGFIFGVDRDYVRRVSKFSKVYVRVSLKAGTPEAFTRKTGANPEAFELPLKAIEHLLDYGVEFHVAGMMDDPRIVSREERVELVKRLAEIDPRLPVRFEGEVMDPYETTLVRLKAAGLDLKWPLEDRYEPISKLFVEWPHAKGKPGI